MSELWWFWAGFWLLIVITLLAMAAPISALVWWAGWRKRAPAPHEPDAVAAPAPADGPFLVYLSGVGDIATNYSTPYEDAFLAAVQERVPGLVVINDVFAYSVENLSLTSQRLMGWFWHWLNVTRLRKGPLKIFGKLIQLRNVLQVAVSADSRYGPIYNYGTAEMIIQSLLRHGYQLGSGRPICLLGYSGGAQIALASAGYVQATLRAPVQVISLAGLLNSNPSLDRISALLHIYGSSDRNQRLGMLLFPARWPLRLGTRWNRALASGKIRLVCVGPMIHAGKGSYLDATQFLEDGRSYMHTVADLVAAQLQKLT